MEYFVSETSIVREIWSNPDTILFIFGGSAAEFTLNKAVDWLYFTGKLPQDPIGRLFSTVVYAHKIIFQKEEKALLAIKSIMQIHKNVEAARGAAIPDWAYRDVLYMLIHYSNAAFELLERKLSMEEKEEVFNVFWRVGNEMELPNLPTNYPDWLVSRNEHLNNDLAYSPLTEDLFKKYKQHLGAFRYKILLQVQKLLVPKQVYVLLKFSKSVYFKTVLYLYKRVKHLALFKEIKFRLLPVKYQETLRTFEYR
ncbi:MAG: oxygenase MpaB family protein [Ginsengibacter sp.]